MNECDEFIGVYSKHLLLSVPRILTHLDRDPDSSSFGSFDRDYWHYKMRDFSSIVLQQGMLVLDALHDYCHLDNPLYQHALVTQWVDASLDFWVSQQLGNGSFNEYYPFEEGYPPTAFSLYAVCLVFRKRGFPVPEDSVKGAIQKSCDWLLDHSEQQAFNQESAGLAGLALASCIPGIKVDADKLEVRLAAFFNSQSPEGWFPEYGGADIGYLSVSLDCLWDYYETTADQRAMAAMERAVMFISHFISVSGATPVMINSRNTDYIVPYGLVRLAASNRQAARIVRSIFSEVGTPSHFLSATDDRYTCHYVYQSCFRALCHISAMTDKVVQLPCEQDGVHFFEKAGVYIRHLAGRHSLYVATKKGGVMYQFTPEGLAAADYGWRWKLPNGKVAVSHWQNGSELLSHTVSEKKATLVMEGRMSIHRWHTATPMRHLLLRLVAFLSGNRLVSMLKNVLIFNAPDAGISYQRAITISKDELGITDTFSGETIKAFHPEPAPHYSLRYVASAGNFTTEELVPRSKTHKTAATGTLETKYETRITLTL